MKHPCAITKKKLFWHVAKPLATVLLVIWLIVSVVGILLLLPRTSSLVIPALVPVLSLLLFAYIFHVATGSLRTDIAQIGKQEEWFGISFDEELHGQVMRRSLHLDANWYIAIDSMHLYAFRQGYLVGIVDRTKESGRAGGTRLTVQAVDGSTFVLAFSDGSNELIAALHKFARAGA